MSKQLLGCARLQLSKLQPHPFTRTPRARIKFFTQSPGEKKKSPRCYSLSILKGSVCLRALVLFNICKEQCSKSEANRSCLTRLALNRRNHYSEPFRTQQRYHCLASLGYQPLRLPLRLGELQDDQLRKVLRIRAQVSRPRDEPRYGRPVAATNRQIFFCLQTT